jgi:hypothetical protein
VNGLYAAFSILIGVSTVAYFSLFLWKPRVFTAVVSTSGVLQLIVGPLSFCAAVGIAALILLGFKEIWYMVALERLGIAYDDYIGGVGFLISFIAMRRFEQIGKSLAE